MVHTTVRNDDYDYWDFSNPRRSEVCGGSEQNRLDSSFSHNLYQESLICGLKSGAHFGGNVQRWRKVTVIMIPWLLDLKDDGVRRIGTGLIASDIYLEYE